MDRLILDVFTPSKATLDTRALYVMVRPSDTPPFDVFDDWEAIDGDANPGQLALSLAHLTGVHEIRIAWNSLYFPTPNSDLRSRSDVVLPRPETVYFPAYIDKIAFTTTLPEPAGVALLGVALAAVTGRYRMIRRRDG